MRFVFTSNVQIGTFGCKQTATSLLRASPAITIHSVSEKIDSTYQPKLFLKAEKISLASKYLVL